VRSVDLNADLGERDRFTELDRAVVEAVTSVSIACGFHAGSPAVMRDTAAACASRGVAVGAHVSYRDRAGFGRRPLDVAPEALAADLSEQIEVLKAAVAEVGVPVAYLKPHGALYHAAASRPEVAGVLVAVVSGLSHRTLVAPGGSEVARQASAAGLLVVREGFPDRAYLPDGGLAPRDAPGAVVGDPEEAAARACTLVLEGGVRAIDGRWTPVEVDTLCIHGDSPDADRRAQAVRRALEAAGVVVRPFAPAAPVEGGAG